MKKIFCVFVFMCLLCGCTASFDEPTVTQTNTLAATSTASCVLEESTVEQTEHPAQTNVPTVIPTQSESQQKNVIYGYVEQVCQDVPMSIKIKCVDIVQHNAGESDKYGNKYENGWTEIIHTDNVISVLISNNAVHLYADIINMQTDNDNTVKLDYISTQKFVEICTLEYFSTKLYFKFEIINDELKYSELLLDYYLNG